MARKEKLTLDYFPHYAVQGDISIIIQEKYGNDGYAVLYKNYEQFCLKDRQYINLNEYVTLAAISAYCKITESRYLEIVSTLTNLGAYDKELWEEHKIICSKKFIENTKDAYRKRTSESIDFEELKNFFRKKSTNKCISDVGNQQNKSNQTKLKEIKEKEIKNNLSLNSSIMIAGDNRKRIGKREREILKSYCLRKKVGNINAYIRKILDNGDYEVILEEERIRLEKLEAKQQKVRNEIAVNPDSEEDVQKAFEESKRKIIELRKRG